MTQCNFWWNECEFLLAEKSKQKLKQHFIDFCRYELDNGQIFSEAGALKDDGSQYVKGSYSFQGDDGETYWVNYTADEEGTMKQIQAFASILFIKQ